MTASTPRLLDLRPCSWPGCEHEVVTGRYPGDESRYCAAHEAEMREIAEEEDTGDPEEATDAT